LTRADQNHVVAWADCSIQTADIDDGLIHGHTSKDRAVLAVQQNSSSVA
jgi:hypothetical protein